MQLEIEDRDTLILTPETDAERERLVAVFGPFGEGDDEPLISASPASGKEVHLTPEGAVRVGLALASWNYDPW